MKIQNMDQRLDGVESVQTAKQFGVLNEAGQVVFVLSLTDDGALEIKSGGVAQNQDGKYLDDHLIISPQSYARVVIDRQQSK